MSVYEDRKQALEEYEFRMGVERGRLAVTLDLLTDALVLVVDFNDSTHNSGWVSVAAAISYINNL